IGCLSPCSASSTQRFESSKPSTQNEESSRRPLKVVGLKQRACARGGVPANFLFSLRPIATSLMTRGSSSAGFAASLPPSDGRPQLCRKLCTSEISRPIQSIPVEVGSKGNPASMLHHHRQLALAIFVPIEANTQIGRAHV